MTPAPSTLPPPPAWDAADVTAHLEVLRELAVHHEGQEAHHRRQGRALRWVLGIVDGDEVTASPLPPSGP